MTTLCIYDIVVYPKTEAHKNIIYKKFRWEANNMWIDIWITKCKNLYYTCSENHPINQYEEQHILLLCHLFYIIQNLSVNCEQNSFEYSFFGLFLNGILEFLRKFSKNSYLISSKDPVANYFFNEYFLPVTVGTYSLSKMRSNIDDIKNENSKLKKDTIDIFSAFQKEIDIFGKNLLENLKNSSNKNVDICVQTDFSNESEKIETKEVSVQTEVITDIVSKKKKGKEDNVVMTSKEYLNLMKMHNDEIDKTREITLKKVEDNLGSFLKIHPQKTSKIYEVMRVQSREDLLDIMNVILLKNSHADFYMYLGERGVDFKLNRVIIPSFFDFWYGIVMPNIGTLKNEIFIQLKEEWEIFVKSFLNCNIKFNSNEIDIVFSYYSSNYLAGTCIINKPPFFTILFKECRNISLLLGLVRVFSVEGKSKTLNLTKMFEDFARLYTCQTAKELLFLHKDKILIEDNMKLIYEF